MLALVHRLPRGIERGEYNERVDITPQFGIIRARNALLNFALLASEIQEQVLKLEAIHEAQPTRSLSRIVFTSPRIRPCSDLCVAKSLKGNQPSCGLSALISKQARTRGSKANARQAPSERALRSIVAVPDWMEPRRRRNRMATVP